MHKALLLLVVPLLFAQDEEKKKKPKTVKIGNVTWYLDYDAAMKVAKKDKKPLWLHFGENPG